ncbi:MAG: hypothetical protein Phog2KO_49610 [Phototrophicaceae bacterium]
MVELIGQFLGQYEIIDEIARGGMATVYRARQASIGRDVAIKVLPSNFTHDRTFIDRFNREVEVIAQLQHPHILPVYDYGEFEGMPYIVMAYINGGTLSDYIVNGPMQAKIVAKMVNQIADALDFAHSKGIVHRDFKPSNVLMDERGNTYLADFGLAKLTESSQDITGTMVVGTPHYMAPEQARSGAITGLVDVYALGVTIYQMLTGQAPYEAPTAAGVMVAHITEPIPNIHDSRPDLPNNIQEIVNNSLAKDPKERYQSSGNLALDLSNALANKDIHADAVEIIQEEINALIMTNMLGHVIFVDDQCLRLLRRHHNEARHIIGKPLAQALGCDTDVANQIMQDISNTGKLDEQAIDIRDSRKKVHTVNCSAIATRDDDGTFVGADITLKLIPDVTDLPSETFITVKDSMDTQESNYVQKYFATQIDALYEMLLQWAGKKVAKNLEDILNETGQRNVWPVSMHNGRMRIELKQSDELIYEALLARAMSYTASILGEKQVIREIEYINKNIDPAEMKYVKTFGLDQLYKNILKN